LLKDSLEDGVFTIWMRLACHSTINSSNVLLKKVHGSSSGNKMQITILECANAVGTTVIFKGE